MAPSERKAKKGSKPACSKKDEKLFRNFLRSLEEFLGGRSYTPLPLHVLMNRLRILPEQEPILRKAIEALIQGGKAEEKDGYLCRKEMPADYVKGTLSLHRRGFGFLRPDPGSGYAEDIFIPKHLTKNAIDGDVVEVLVNTECISEKGPEGKIVSILSRGRTHLAGIIRRIEPYGEILAYVPLLGQSQRVVVSPGEHDLRVGDRVVMEVEEWGEKDTETLCKMSHHIGHISDPSCDVRAAIEEFELRADFPHEALEEARSFKTTVSQKDMAGREDLRHWECFSIDPETAKDFDDVISLTQDEQGRYTLGVHIADVTHYVKPGSALDHEARQRCNSTYFPGYCLPMLPQELSNNLCSLKQGVNRLTVSIIMDFNPQGDLADYRITRSVIRSKKRFTYEEAREILDGKKKSLHAPMLKLMQEFCGHLKKKRCERGSIEFSIPEVVVRVDEEGVPHGTYQVEYDITHQMVEEFMLKANEVVAQHSSRQGTGLTYRVHEIPAEENMKDFAAMAAAFGFNISENPTASELQKLFDEALETPYGQYLATNYIRKMRLAVYSAENIGHYGLALQHYCHFTSPIRRYVDTIVHRILLGEYDSENESLEAIADKCSEQERVSAKAEGNVILLKKLRLLESVQKQDKWKTYEAIVTRVKNFGFSFEVIHLMLESFIHVSELEDDYYSYNDSRMTLQGNHLGKSYAAGDKILVVLKNVDFITLDSKWSFTGRIDDETIRRRPLKITSQKKRAKKNPSKKTGRSKRGRGW